MRSITFRKAREDISADNILATVDRLTKFYDYEDIRGLIVHELGPFDLWLAQKVSEWRKRYIGD
jgi:hypothetical protein